jgi:hypothetical protein
MKSPGGPAHIFFHLMLPDPDDAPTELLQVRSHLFIPRDIPLEFGPPELSV